MNHYLEAILKEKQSEINELYNTITLTKFEKEYPQVFTYAPRAFHKALSQKGLRLIAEIKKASPSKGIIREDFDPLSLAQIFEQSGASALSILTEKNYFKGNLDTLTTIKKISPLPILRKDFITDPIQVYESKKSGADAILLIKAILSTHTLRDLQTLAHRIGLDVLVEVHTEEELAEVLPLGCPIIGFNNRDLNEFKVDIATAKLRNKIPISPPTPLLVAESGYSSIEELKDLKRLGFNGVLIGEGLATHPSLLSQLSELT